MKSETDLRKKLRIYIPKAAGSKREEAKKRMNAKEEEEEKAMGFDLFSRWLVIERMVKGVIILGLRGSGTEG